MDLQLFYEHVLDMAIIILYPTSAIGRIVQLKTPQNLKWMLPTLFCKNQVIEC